MSIEHAFGIPNEINPRGVIKANGRRQRHAAVLRRHRGHAPPPERHHFHRDHAKWMLPRLAPEGRLQGLTPEEILRRLPPEDILRGLDNDKLAQLRALLDAAAPKDD